MNRTDTSDNKIQINQFDIKRSLVQDDHSNNNKYDSQTPSINKDNCEKGSHEELDSSQHLEHLKSNKIVDHEDQVILTKKTYNSTSASVTGSSSTDTSLQGLFLQYLYETVFYIYVASTKTSLWLYTYY